MPWPACSKPLVLAAALLIGCAGAGLHAGVYSGHGMRFEVGEVPASWRPIEVSHGLMAFRDEADSMTVAVNGRCGVDGDDVPLAALTQHLFMVFTDRQVQSQRVIPMDGREAMRTAMQAKLDGVPKSFVIYVLKKDGCVYDFLFISEPDRADAGTPAFDRFVGGFHTLGRR